MNKDGYSTKNSSRKEGQQEGTERLCLQQSPSASVGSHARKEWSQEIFVQIENSSQDRTLAIHATTTEQVRQEIFREIPSFFSNKLGFQFFLDPISIKGRAPIEGNLPPISKIYATVYLVKH
jgi:hypothetical protein